MNNKVFAKFSQTILGRKINDSLKEILRKAKADRGIVIFLSRKGYWLYQVFRRYGDWEKELLNNIIVVSDRYVTKWFSPEWEDRTFYIIDDTVTTGLTMYHIYERIRSWYKTDKIHCIALFTRMTGAELRRSLEGRLTGEGEPKYLQNFLDSFETFGRVSVEQVGWLSYSQIYLFQKLLIPYVVDLPTVADEKYKYKETENKDNHHHSVCAEKWFEGLRQMQGDWVYEDNSYSWNNMLEEDAVPEEIQCGYFRCIDPNIYNRVGDILFQIVIKCRYETGDDGNLNIVFTPFAILNSMTCEDAYSVCSALYKDTVFLSELENQRKESEKGPDEVVERYNTLLLRSIVYFFSLYGWISFKSAAEKTAGWETAEPPVSVKIDLSYLHENSANSFVGVVDKMKEWKQENFLQCIQGMKAVNDILPVAVRRNEDLPIEDNDSMQAYILLYCAILDRKRSNISDAFISIEELYGILGNSMVSRDEEARRTLFIHVLLQMLDQSVLGNSIKCSADGYVMRGFRYGENSDIALPFYNSYIYYGVAKLYSRCIWRAVFQTEETKKLFLGRIHALFNGIRNMAAKNGYLGVLISEEELKYGEWYFSNERADLTTMVENKQFRLNADKRLSAVENDIDFCVDELIQV